jgi:conjugal transfer pilus assembly protein TraE
MNISNFLQTWRGTNVENRVLRLVSLGLVVIGIILAQAYASKDTIVMLVPPHVDEKLEISKNMASEETKKAWGLYLAQLIGNVTPGSADFIAEAIEPLLSPAIYKSVRENLALQIEALKLEKVTLSFQPRAVAYEPESNRVYVNGTLVSSGLGDAQEKTNRTYEMEIKIENYRPVITFLDVYKGGMKDARKKAQISAAEERQRQHELERAQR